MSDFDFSAVDFGSDIDFAPKVPPPVVADLPDQAIYPEACRSPLFLDWQPSEEDLQSAALGWFLVWRRANTFTIQGNLIKWILPPEDRNLWNALGERMTDWAFLEKGGLDLEATHAILIRRHQIRLATTPDRTLTTRPAGAGIQRKETPDVRKPSKQNSSTQRNDQRNDRRLQQGVKHSTSSGSIRLDGLDCEEIPA